VHTRDEITLAGMRFHALVGVLAHERELPQPLEVDLAVRLTSAMRGDVPTLDYRAVYDVARRVVAAGPLDYLERTAERIAAGALALDGVIGVRVAVRKPHVALGGPLAYAQVVVDRERPSAGSAADA
jgi:dihydroneopterin aldolase